VGLLRDIFYLVFLIGHEITTDTTTKSVDDELPQDANVIANFLGEALDECRRLLAAPGLFPSRSQQKAFLKKVASLCPIIESIGEIEKQNRSSMRRVLSRDPNSIALMCSDNPDNDPTESGSLHPDARDAKNPWNNWLDNSANATPGWIAIQQKIPRVGDVLNRKKGYDYDALEASIEEVSSSNLQGKELYKIQELTWTSRTN
jgi:hypothetical protein